MFEVFASHAHMLHVNAFCKCCHNSSGCPAAAAPFPRAGYPAHAWGRRFDLAYCHFELAYCSIEFAYYYFEIALIG